MKKKVLSVFLCGVMAASMLAGCGSSGKEEVVTNTDAQDAAEDSADDAAEDDTASADSDMAYVVDKGTLVVGITDFEPMDYKDDNGDWVGFDADMAKAFAESLGVDVEFVEIDWDNKVPGAGRQEHRLCMERNDPD